MADQYGEVSVLFKVVYGNLRADEINEAITRALHNLKVEHENGVLVLLDATDPQPAGTNTAWEDLDNWYGDTPEAHQYGFPVAADKDAGWTE